MLIQKMLLVVSMLTLINSVYPQSLTNTVHKTQAAAEKHNDMWCYSCHSMEDGDICIDNITANYSSFMKKCKDEEFICMVKKFSYTTSTENSTSSPKMWSLERKCSAHCENGCIVIGERTKLYACTSCCNTSYCNSGKGKGVKTIAKLLPYISVFCVQFLMFILIL
ncbi:uncharacterized protein LOC119077475 [Bradysia coprophila]|uniref:uncharacterized protein LOC119077475 n=1 Tax=Bradysia coprophila TaxID=38358 RepID=UPI00187DC930|nr:uncharacterized protein LOC119077475 [Bradysia coprophila]